MSTSDDTSALWTALMQAKDDGDINLVRAIEQRRRELTSGRANQQAGIEITLAGLKAEWDRRQAG